MKNKKVKKRIIYPISLSPEMYDFITEVTKMYLASTKANIMRQALQIGLETMAAKHE